MSVSGHAARWAMAGALLSALVAVPASPALAADDRVGLRAARSFDADGSPGTVTLSVRKRTDGCVALRTVLGLRLADVRADQVRVEVATGGRWTPVAVTGGGGAVATVPMEPVDRPLCEGRAASVRYRVSFLTGTAGGRLELVGEASAANGRVLGRAAGSARVEGAPRTPSPSPSRKPTPTPSAAVTTPAETASTSPVAAAVVPVAGAAADDSSFGGSLIMWFGIALVLAGAALIVLLVRRSRADRTDRAGGTPGADLPPVPLPRSTTVYRAGTSGPTPTVYGGGVTPPRPAGNVYGAPASGPAVPAPSGPAGSGPAAPAPSDPPPSGSGPKPPAPGGDATSLLPRLPD
ncbi:hypothetical protein [Micromonospora sp. DT31]|uniref:hypothetical protein n=1 Tax=Micromonospora sp. DT31 TaxID=3393434 RepID=UPI003CEA0121